LEQNYFIWHETKNESKIGHKESEEKGEYESPKNESLFQRGYPNHALTFRLCVLRWKHTRVSQNRWQMAHIKVHLTMYLIIGLKYEYLNDSKVNNFPNFQFHVMIL